MSVRFYFLLILATLSLNTCMVNMTKPTEGVRIETTGTDPNTGVQLNKQENIRIVINSRGHPQNVSNQYISDGEYAATLRRVLNDSFFAQKKRAMVEEIDAETTPYRYLLDLYSEDPCVLYISYTNFEDKQYSTVTGGGGYWMNGMYMPAGNVTNNPYLRTTFTIQVIFYGKFSDQYMVYNEIPTPASKSYDEFIKSIYFNCRTVVDEFYMHIYGY